MNKAKFKDLLSNYFLSPVDELDFEEASWLDQGGGKENLSPRDSLRYTFCRRLHGMGEENEFKQEIERFVSQLDDLPADANLYSWSCSLDEDKYFGWASDCKVIYSVKSKKVKT